MTVLFCHHLTLVFFLWDRSVQGRHRYRNWVSWMVGNGLFQATQKTILYHYVGPFSWCILIPDRKKASCSGMTFCRLSVWHYWLHIHTFLSSPAWHQWTGKSSAERCTLRSNVIWWGDAQLCKMLSVTRLSGKCCVFLEPDYERGKLAAVLQHKTGETGSWGCLERSSWCPVWALSWSSMSAVS